MHFLEKVKKLGPPKIGQRLRDAGDGESITKAEFNMFCSKIGIMPSYILSLERVVGFNVVNKQLVDDILLKIEQRIKNILFIEEEVFKNLAMELKKKDLDIEAAFRYFEKSGDGILSFGELTSGLKALHIELSRADRQKLIEILDADKNGVIDLLDFEKRLSKYMGKINVPLAEVFKDSEQIDA